MASKAKITLAGKEIQLTWDNGASARLQSLKNGTPPPKDFKNPRKAFFAVCAWVWAMLPKEERRKYEDPDEVAEDVQLDKMSDYVDAMNAAIEEANPAEGTPGNG